MRTPPLSCVCSITLVRLAATTRETDYLAIPGSAAVYDIQLPRIPLTRGNELRWSNTLHTSILKRSSNDWTMSCATSSGNTNGSQTRCMVRRQQRLHTTLYLHLIGPIEIERYKSYPLPTENHVLDCRSDAANS